MLTRRPASERGGGHHGWLDTRHTFSFADYRDPNWTRFGSLRVMNEDVIAPGKGFGMHPHRDMEILTCVLSGSLAHRDSLGFQETLRPGEWQHFSAGTGVFHSEFNPSEVDPVHLYQIWMLPREHGLTPRYAQKAFPESGYQDQWQLIASPQGESGSLAIEQEARLWMASFQKGNTVPFPAVTGRQQWLQAIKGRLTVGGVVLETGDGLAIEEETDVMLRIDDPSTVMLFDLQ